MSDMSFFKPAARYPADPRAIFILALSVFSGLTALVIDVAPESLEAVLPRWGVVLWGAILCIGSAITLLGMMRQTVGGIVTEQVGSVMVGVATVYYSTLVFATLGGSAIQTVGIIMAWGIACFIRWGQLQSLLHDAAKRKSKQELLDKIHAEIEDRKAKNGERVKNRPGHPL